VTRYVDAESLRKVPFRTVFVEVEVDLLASLLGRRFNGPDGAVSMEQVDIRFDDDLGIFRAEPLVVRTSPLCTCGDCAYCRQ